jgi:hypothetical protein
MTNNKSPNLFLIVFFALIGILSIIGCKHEPLYPSVCFEYDILPIFSANCVSSGCHNSKDAAAGIILNNYDNIIAGGIVSNNARKSDIYKAIKGKEDLMPPGGKLSDNQITLIYSWIETGAENTTGCGTWNLTDTAHNCDTLNVKYTTTIKPIIDGCCLICHNPGPENFNGYLALNTFITENQQTFLNAIDRIGENPMPPSGKLSDCYIKQIKIWIQAGSPNN